MKTVFVSDLRITVLPASPVVLYGWVRAKRKHGDVVFLDIADSTGYIQVVVERPKVASGVYDLARHLAVEAAVQVFGQLVDTGKSAPHDREIAVRYLELVGMATLNLCPSPRGELDIFDPHLQEQLMNNRHFYLRNEKVMAIMKFRHLLMGCIHQWFRSRRFTEITAPILTPTPLYEDRSAMSLDVHGQRIFLTQCVGFYLESAVHAFERVYNIGPSFRGEESRSKRHLMEYWHIKAEVAFAGFEDIIALVEELIRDVTVMCREQTTDLAQTIGTTICEDGIAIPFPRICYEDAVKELQKLGIKIEFGASLGSEEEAMLSRQFPGPFWVTGIPRSIEPFPYVIDPHDPRITRTADLIASRGYGELLGIAEKIHDLSMLDERMMEKGKSGNIQYEWLRDLRKFGCVPHAGFGLGVERFIRWLLQIPHVRDAIPFFRTFGRKVQP